MSKKSIIKQIQDRLPDDIQVADETSFEFTDDEFLSILSWVKYFNWHYELEGKSGAPAIQSPVISKRIRIDFYFYWINEKNRTGETGYKIYILPNVKTNHLQTQNYTVKEIIDIFKL